MTREEAINEIKSWDFLEGKEIEAIHTLIPELCESEDEKIRKSLIGLVEKFMTDERKEKTLAWLEKMKEYPTNEEMLRTLRAEYEKGVADTIVKYEQKKQKLVPKFKVGDTIKKKGKEYTFTIDEIRDEFYLAEDWRFLPFDQQDKWELVGQKEQKPADSSVYPPSLEEAIKLYYNTYGNDRGGFDYMSLPKFQDIVETFVKDYGQKPAEWSANDKAFIKDCARILDENYYTESAERLLSMFPIKSAEWNDDIIQKAIKEVGLTQYQIDWFKTNVFPPKQEWSEEDKEMFRIISNRVEKFDEWATEKGYHIDDPTMKQSPITWFKSLPERFNLQPKNEWNDEDEMMATSILNVLKRFEHLGATDMKIDWLQNKLKSFRPSWKPSEEQMTRLNECVIEARERHSASTSGYERYRILNSLYTDLKKLM